MIFSVCLVCLYMIYMLVVPGEHYDFFYAYIMLPIDELDSEFAGLE